MCRVKNCNKILSSKTWQEPKTVMFSELQEIHTKLTEQILLCQITASLVYTLLG